LSNVELQIREHMVIDPYSGNYYPTVWFNDFWLLKEHLLPLNDTVPEVRCRVAPLTPSLPSSSCLFTCFPTIRLETYRIR
jgi:hypothetical protein